MRTLALALSLLLLPCSLRAQTFEIRFHDFENSCWPVLAGAVTGPAVVTLTLRGGLASEPCFWILGLQRTRLPIPVYGCEMYVVPLLTATTAANASGTASLELRLPALVETTVFTQAASVRLAPSQLHASNGLEIEIRQK